MPTPEIFDFDTSDMDYQEEKATDALLSHPSIYVNHLEIARRLTIWSNRIGEMNMGNPEYNSAFRHGLEEVAAHLRQGDFVPDSTFLVEGRESEEDRQERLSSLLPSHGKSHGSAANEQGTNGNRPT